MTFPMLSQQPAPLLLSSPSPLSSSKLCDAPWPADHYHLQHRSQQQQLQHHFPVEPRSVLDLRSPSPASSSLSPSFGASSCESGGGGGGGAGLHSQIDYHRHVDEAEGKAAAAAEQELEVPLIDCRGLSAWQGVGDDGEFELGHISGSAHDGTDACWRGEGGGDEGRGHVVEEGVWSAAAGGEGFDLAGGSMSSNAAADSVVEMFVGGNGGPTLDEVFGCLVEDGGGGGIVGGGGDHLIRLQAASCGYGDGGGLIGGEFSDEHLFGQVSEPKPRDGLWNLGEMLPNTASTANFHFRAQPSSGPAALLPAGPSSPLHLLQHHHHTNQQQQHQQEQQRGERGLQFLSAPCSIPQSKRPRFSSFPPLLPPHPQSTLSSPPSAEHPFLHNSFAKQHTFSLPPPPLHHPPLHHHHHSLSASHPAPASPPWPPLPFSRMLTPTPPIHFADLDSSHLRSPHSPHAPHPHPHPHPHLLGKNIPLDELLHTGQQLTMAAEAAELGNIDLTQAILARLNLPPPHLLSPREKRQHIPPLQRAASLFKEAIAHHAGIASPSPSPNPTLQAISKICAYKSFCEASPLPRFSNFIANQATLEAIEGQDRVHVIDFELGLGERWASLMQELLQKGKVPSQLTVTAVVVGNSNEGLLCELARESLLEFAKGLNMTFLFEAVPLAKLSPLIRPEMNQEALLVNLGSCGLTQTLAELGSPEPLLNLLRFIKSLSPKVITMTDSECYTGGGAGSSFLNQSLKLCACLLETLDCSDAGVDAVAGIERFLLAPQIANAVKMRRVRQNLPPWRNLLQRAGFSPIACSAAAEAQVGCLINSAPAGCLLKGPNTGFTLAKQQSNLVLAWHNINLLQGSTWES